MQPNAPDKNLGTDSGYVELLVSRGKSHNMVTQPEVTEAYRPITGFQKFFWLKYVTGFNSAKHCAQCLYGTHSKKVHYRIPIGVPIVLDEARTPYQYIYLCGVSIPGYSSNLHMPVIPALGEAAVMFTFNGYRIEMKGARNVPIPALPIGWNGYGREYTTCRNFRFAAHYYGLEKTLL